MGELAGMLVDMDGTLLDSEKIWDVALDDLAAALGGTLSIAARASMVGSNIWRSIAIVHEDLGVSADPAASAELLNQRTAELFGTDLVWKPGAQELLGEVNSAGVPIALVTSTYRELTEIALGFMGHRWFAATVCGDEVTAPKPAPDPYLKAADLIGADVTSCVAIEDSPLGIASAEAAGCAVIAVPSEVPITPASTRTIVTSLRDVDLAFLRQLR